MREGQASRTAELVCAARAVADGAVGLHFRDPTAFVLLSEASRERVERARSDVAPAGLRARAQWAYMRRQSKMMAMRTLAVDEAVRGVASPQVVILGAGLDGRAWRMTELQQATVFEVDHPDTQRVKQARAAALSQTARDIRFVPVDFQKDALDAALEKAGHNPALPTTWIWEGVVMYLTRAEVTATLQVLSRRSATASRLIIVYLQPALIMLVSGLVLRRMGEPFRSAFTPRAMRALLGRHGFRVVRDDDIPTLAAAISRSIARELKIIKHLRVVTADR